MDRIQKIKDDPFYKECLSLNGDRERDRLFCRHDFQHMLDVSQISYNMITGAVSLDEFAAKEGLPGVTGASEVIFAAGLLHDIGRWRQYDNGEDHAQAGAVMARPVLERAGFLKEEIKAITSAIGDHRRAGPGSSFLGRVICLADDLSRPCGTCNARLDCYKYEYMETIRERSRHGSLPDVG